MRRRIKVGEEFDGQMRLVNANANARKERVRSYIALGFLALSGSVLLGALVIGIWEDSFEKAQSLWLVLGPLVGAVFTYYFGPSKGNKDEPKNNQEE